MQSSKFLTFFVIVFSEILQATASDTPLSGETLQSMEGGLPLTVAIRRRFLFSPLVDEGTNHAVFVCEIDRSSSGGQFCFVSTNGTPHMLANETGDPLDVFNCLPSDWYHLVDVSGKVSLAVIAMRRWHDGADDAGLVKESFVSEYFFEDDHVFESNANARVSSLIARQDFRLLERPRWYSARKAENGGWSAAPVSNATSFCTGGMPMCGSSPELVASFRAMMLNQPSVAPSESAQFVIESSQGQSPSFTLFSNGTDTTEDGCLWIPFLWNGTEWTDVPTNGFACSSGHCPSTFRAKPDEFYRLTISGEQPRLVVLKSRDGRLREVLWEEALGARGGALNFDNGLPDKDYMRVFGLPDVPISFVQSIVHGGPFIRLERIVPERVQP